MSASGSAFPVQDFLNEMASCVFTRLSELANADLLGNPALSKAIADLVRDLRGQIFGTDVAAVLGSAAVAGLLPYLQVQAEVLCATRPASPGSAVGTGGKIASDVANWIAMLLVVLDNLATLLHSLPGISNMLHVLRGLLQMALLVS